MREPLRDKERLEHMLAAAERVIRYTSGKSFEDLKAQRDANVSAPFGPFGFPKI